MKNNHFIWILILSAFFLRIVGIFDGLPAAYNSTEYFLAKTALSMGARQSLDPLIYIYPTLYTYLLLSLYMILYLIGNLLGIFIDSIDFAIQFLTDPSIFYLTGRIINVLVSLLTIVIFYKLSRRIFGETTARFAALIAALMYHFVQFSRFAVPDTLLIFFSTVATLLILQTYYHPSQKNYALSGLFIGLAIGTKYNAGFLILGLLMVYILHRIEHRQTKFWQNSLAGFLSLFIGFFIFNPLWLLKFSDFFEGYRLMSAQMSTAVSLDYGKNYIWEISEIIKSELLIGVGFFLASLVAVIKRKPVHLILLVPVLATFIYVGSWQKKGIDYLFAVFPAWIIMFSLWLDKLSAKIKNRKFLKALLFIVLFVPPLLMNIYQDVISLKMDTRELATEWIKKNISKDEQICYDHYTFDLGLFDVYRYTDYGASSAQLPEVVKKRILNYANHPSNVSNVPIHIKFEKKMTDVDNPYDAEISQYRRKSLIELQSEGVTYLITNSWFYGPYLECDIEKFTPIMKQRINEVREFYQDIDNIGKKRIIFKPDFWNPGPLIIVYEI